MLYPFDDRRPFADLNHHLDRLRRLVLDLEDIRLGRHPDEATLADAPRLENWAVARRAEPCLAGTMIGHPRIADGPGFTSSLWVVAPRLGYARTLNRFYTLARPGESCGIGRRFS